MENQLLQSSEQVIEENAQHDRHGPQRAVSGQCHSTR